MQKSDPHFIPVQLALDAPVPSVELMVKKDDHGGWNLQVLTSNFVFAPEDCGKEHVDGFGHAHFYLNGEKGSPPVQPLVSHCGFAPWQA